MPNSHRARWPDFSLYRPHPPAATLRQWVAQTRAQSWAWLGDLSGPALLGPRLALVNPPQWEVGHLAWFWEKWLLRAGDAAGVPSDLVPNTDALYDSMAVAHDTRWDLPLLSWNDTWQYLDAVLERVDARLAQASVETGVGTSMGASAGDQRAADELAYFTQLCVFHQDMHNEAFAIRRQLLGDMAMLDGLKALGHKGFDDDASGTRMDITFAAGVHQQGAAPHNGFVFDNEKWAHPRTHEAFAIASQPVTQGEYARFLDAGFAEHAPLVWRKRAHWERRVFDTWVPLASEAPVVHVSAEQAQAYCGWARRRLPTETEWEVAQPQLQGQMQVWEWTASPFAAYGAFSPDPYVEYSEPWFDGAYRVLRGGSVATVARNIRRTWRNFYKPARSDMFCGFRTCAATLG